MKKYSKLFALLNVILYLVVIATWISIPDELTLNISLTVFNLLITSMLIVFNKEYFKTFYSSSFFKNFTSAFISVVLLFGILGFVNYLAFKNTIQIDLSKDMHNTLTDQTKKVLSRIDAPLEAIVFAPKSNSGHFKALLNLYFYENNNISIRVVDPSVRPDLVKKYNIQKSGSILLTYKDKQEIVTQTTELSVTNAIIKLSRDKQPKVMVVIGHGEKSFKEDSPEGFSNLSNKIEQTSINLEYKDLRQLSSIESHYDLLIIWGPRRDFMKHEISLLSSYLDRGGNLLVSIDPDLNQLNLEKLRELLKKYSIKINNDLVIDVESHVQGSNGTVPLAKRFNKKNLISKEMQDPVFFPVVSSIEFLENEDNKTESLIETTPFPGSWAERNPQEFVDNKVKFTDGEDLIGPVKLGVAVKTKANNKIVVFGNSNFVSNKYLKYASNSILLLNSVSWLTGNDQIISFNLPVVENEPVFIGRPQVGIIFYFSVIFVPVLLVIVSIYVYRRRIKL